MTPETAVEGERGFHLVLDLQLGKVFVIERTSKRKQKIGCGPSSQPSTQLAKTGSSAQHRTGWSDSGMKVLGWRTSHTNSGLRQA
jgi:hypothetical protein